MTRAAFSRISPRAARASARRWRRSSFTRRISSRGRQRRRSSGSLGTCGRMRMYSMGWSVGPCPDAPSSSRMRHQLTLIHCPCPGSRRGPGSRAAPPAREGGRRLPAPGRGGPRRARCCRSGCTARRSQRLRARAPGAGRGAARRAGAAALAVAGQRLRGLSAPQTMHGLSAMLLLSRSGWRLPFSRSGRCEHYSGIPTPVGPSVCLPRPSDDRASGTPLGSQVAGYRAARGL